MITTLKLWESMMGSHCLWELPGSYHFQHKYAIIFSRLRAQDVRVAFGGELRIHMGGSQNYGPFLGTLNIRCRIIIGIHKATIILTTTHMYIRIAYQTLQRALRLVGLNPISLQPQTQYPKP